MERKISNKYADFYKKIVFKDANRPVQIFCPQKYRGYYIRGQACQFSDANYDSRYPEGHNYAYYYAIIFVLINDRHVKHMEGLEGDYNDFGYFIHKTIDEYKAEKEREVKSYLEFSIEQDEKLMELNNELKEHDPKKLSQFLMNKRIESLSLYSNKDNDPIEIDIKDINFTESPYLLNALKHKSDNILIKKLLSYDRDEPQANHSAIDPQKHIYYLSAFHAADSCYNSEKYIAQIVELLPGFYSSDEYSLDLSHKNKYFSDFEDVGEVTREWITTKSFSQKAIKSLNILYAKLKDRTDPYKEYYLTFLEDLILDLKENKIIGECSRCKSFFKYFRTKKYCSKKSDGKDCGKAAHNSRYYAENRKTILPKNKAYARKYRTE